MSEERAVLAGGCSGVCSILFAATTAYCRQARVYGRRCAQRHLSQSRHPCRRGRGDLRPFAHQLSADSRVLLPDFTTRARAIGKATTPGRAIAMPSSTPATRRRRIAEDTIADVDASGLWPGKVVTESFRRSTSGRPSPSTRITSRLSGGYTCHFVRPKWRLPVRTEKMLRSVTGEGNMPELQREHPCSHRRAATFADARRSHTPITTVETGALHRSGSPPGGKRRPHGAARSAEAHRRARTDFRRRQPAASGRRHRRRDHRACSARRYTLSWFRWRMRFCPPRTRSSATTGARSHAGVAARSLPNGWSVNRA